MLAGATLAAVVWIGWDALSSDRPGPRARLVMALALALLAALPASLLAADNGLWSGRFSGLTGGLTLWSIGIVSLAAGSRGAAFVRLPQRFAAAPVESGQLSAVVPSRQRGHHRPLIVGGIVLLSSCAFVIKVGGPIAYFKNLDNTASLDFGLTYLLWGISFAKFGAFSYLGEGWAHGRGATPRVVAAVGLALVLLLFIGSRLLLLVALIQLLVMYAALRPISRRFRLALAATAVVGVVVFVFLGELRRWQSLPHHRSFPTYFVHVSLPELPRTYVNQYADAVRLSVIAREVVPRHAGYEYGKEFLRLLLQPIPGGLRPAVGMAPALTAVFTSGKKNGDALPIPVEGYIEFGLVGTVIFSALLGLFVGLIDRLGAAIRDVGWLMASIAAGTGAVIVFRGSLHQGIALATIDVVGFPIAHRFLFRRVPEPAAGWPALAHIGAGIDPAAPSSASASASATRQKARHSQIS
ncbi:MAG: hypothetical protein ACLP01_04570 [Solirubrobacteraceae bacterium]